VALISVDLVDGEIATRTPLLNALQAAAFQVRAYGPDEMLIAMTAHRPRVVIARAEPGSPQADRLLNELADQQLAWLPVVLIANDDSDRVYIQDFKTGVVDLWKPGPPNILAQKLGALATDLAERNDGWSGAGDGKALQAFLAFARRTLRTGLLTVRDKQNTEGQLTLVQGAVRSASYQGRAKQDAVKALTVLSQAQFTFSQPQHSAEPGMVFEMGADVEEGGVPNVAPSDPVTAAVAAAAGIKAAQPPATSEPVLLVDDDTDLRKLFSTFFSKKGYQVRTAEDGAQALLAAQTELPGLVLADLNMPRIDGWALLRFLREDVRTREVPVALFSAQDQYRDALRALQAGAQGFYPKTLKLDALETQVRELLEPRARFRRIVSGKQGLSVDVGSLGPAWVLRTLASLQFTGALEASDGWTRYRVLMTRGNLNEVSGKTGNHGAEGDPALAAFLMVKHAEGSFNFEASGSLVRTEPVASALARVLDALAAQQAATRASMLKEAKGFDVHPELYALYLQVGPPRLRDAARALCEARLHPMQVAERAGLSPQEMEAFVLDLVRRGVMRLT
jgi:DNA-binding response OmpR family regulator